jgi:PHD/YefM family antitoxin component YafN of YafNO toxin-antitoxin module
MNTLSAAELKRRGMAAIEDRLRHGPVHLLKHNKPSAVVLSEDEYARLAKRSRGEAPAGMTALQWLLNQPRRGTKSKAQIDKELREERNDWK